MLCRIHQTWVELYATSRTPLLVVAMPLLLTYAANTHFSYSFLCSNEFMFVAAGIRWVVELAIASKSVLWGEALGAANIVTADPVLVAFDATVRGWSV